MYWTQSASAKCFFGPSMRLASDLIVNDDDGLLAVQIDQTSEHALVLLLVTLWPNVGPICVARFGPLLAPKLAQDRSKRRLNH